MKITQLQIHIIFSIVLLLAPHHLNFAAIRQDPLLVCAIMIKNEAPVIEQTLKAMSDGGIDSFVVYDTGSTDTTVAAVEKFFHDQNITNFAIEQEEFIDFSTSRNKALDLVDKYFPDAVFIFMPDAEWILHNGPELIEFCEEHKREPFASYGINLIMNDSTEFAVERLIRKNSRIRFCGSVHETLEYSSGLSVPSSVFIEFKPTKHGADKSFERFKRDIKLLLKDFANDPKDPRTVFYLAQTYACLGDHENACRFYELRIRLNGWSEENFMAVYRLAQEIEVVAEQDTKKETMYTWELAQHYYLKAYSMRNTRIEPLIHIALHYLNNGNNALAYLFALRACTVNYPASDRLFIEKEMYQYTCYDVVGRSAWYIGEFDMGEWALEKALENYPGDKHFEENLSFYIKRNDTKHESARPELVEGNEQSDIQSNVHSPALQGTSGQASTGCLLCQGFVDQAAQTVTRVLDHSLTTTTENMQEQH